MVQEVLAKSIRRKGKKRKQKLSIIQICKEEVIPTHKGHNPIKRKSDPKKSANKGIQESSHNYRLTMNNPKMKLENTICNKSKTMNLEFHFAVQHKKPEIVT